MAAAAFRECALAAGWENMALSSSGGGNFTGSITKASPTSTTRSVLPLFSPWRLHQSRGKTDKRLVVRVTEVTFIGLNYPRVCDGGKPRAVLRAGFPS